MSVIPSLAVPDFTPKWKEFFAGRVRAVVSGCVLWLGAKRATGYGTVSYGGRGQQVHRVSWQLAYGPIPEAPTFHGVCVCHHCDVRSCVNPRHLFLGSQRDNILDMEVKGRGRHPEGSKHVNSKLDEERVREIRREYATGRFRQVDLAQKYGVGQVLISLVVRRKLWDHV